MGEFFRGWRRRIGVMTLVVTCIITGCWVRSRNRVDLIFLHGIWSNHVFVSGCDKFGLIEGGVFKVTQNMTRNGVETVLSPDSRFVGSISPVRHHGWQASSLRICSSSTNDNVHTALTPYWSIVFPLTLISAYLLLSKPRISTPMKITDPIPTEGT